MFLPREGYIVLIEGSRFTKICQIKTKSERVFLNLKNKSEVKQINIYSKNYVLKLTGGNNSLESHGK